MLSREGAGRLVRLEVVHRLVQRGLRGMLGVAWVRGGDWESRGAD